MSTYYAEFTTPCPSCDYQFKGKVDKKTKEGVCPRCGESIKVQSTMSMHYMYKEAWPNYYKQLMKLRKKDREVCRRI